MIEFSKGSKPVASATDEDLCGWERLYQPAQFDEGVSKTQEVPDFRLAPGTHPQFMKHRVNQIHNPVEPVHFVRIQTLVEYADVDIGVEDNFFLHFSHRFKIKGPCIGECCFRDLDVCVELL